MSVNAKRLPPDWREIARRHRAEVRADVQARIGPAAIPLLIQDPEADTLGLGRRIARDAARRVVARLADSDMLALIAAQIERLHAPAQNPDADGRSGATPDSGSTCHERAIRADLAEILRCHAHEIATEAYAVLLGEAARAAEQELASLRETARTAHGRLVLHAQMVGGEAPREG